MAILLDLIEHPFELQNLQTGTDSYANKLKIKHGLKMRIHEIRTQKWE